jgi:hypothetical protein
MISYTHSILRYLKGKSNRSKSKEHQKWGNAHSNLKQQSMKEANLQLPLQKRDYEDNYN